ncbi:hypothetical protein D915_010578 [Fasciola hepatica]|uniref:Uncharacterized protein n=1 Tax=Fasciola hepatica TaxID=6192 RepID=A0A4E0QZJ8_FASHE|nr:hypothetical protein D915_010578 [Fasciola hepatica]
MSLVKLVSLMNEGVIISKPECTRDNRFPISDTAKSVGSRADVSPVTFHPDVRFADPDIKHGNEPTLSARTAVSTPDGINWAQQSTMFKIPNCAEQEPSKSVPSAVLDMAISRCKAFLSFKYNRDIDLPTEDISDKGLPWDDFLAWYYIARK